MAKITIRDVAEEAGFGIGTVSRVLNNSPHVSDKTRQRVLTVIEEMGYRPNAVARQLPRKLHYQTIGVITRPFIEYYSFAERLRGVQRALRPVENQYELALYNTHTTKGYNERFMSIIETSVMDGLLVIDFDLTVEQKRMLRQMGIPVVGLNHVHAKDWPCIGTDNEMGGYMATQHLIELGHHRIAYVGNELIDKDGFPTSGERYQGYLRALNEAGIEPNADYLRVGGIGYDPAREMAADLLCLPQPPTAIFAMSDTQALGCMAAASQLGLNVPDDLSIMGYDDVEVSYHTGLSTVRQHLELSGEVAMNYLIKLIQGKADPIPPILPPLEVIERRTTKSI